MYTILTIELNSGKTFSKNKLKRFYCFLKIFAKKYTIFDQGHLTTYLLHIELHTCIYPGTCSW